MKPNKATKLLSFLTSFVILLTTVFNSPVASSVSVFADDSVTVSVQNKAYTDVLLSRGKTRANTDKFESDLKKALVKEGVDTSNVKFIKNDSVQMVGSEGFNQYTWLSGANQSGLRNSTSGNILCSNYLGTFQFEGSDLHLTGNSTDGGNMVLKSSMPDGAYKYTMDFDYVADFGDNFNGVGMFFQSTLDSSDEGIIAIIGYLSSDYNVCLGAASGVYKVKLDSHGMYTIVGPSLATVPSSGHFSIAVTNDEVTVNGTKIPGTYSGKDWGFVTSQYDHGCDDIGSFYFRNLKVNIETSKEFKKVLTEEQDNWSDRYTHVMVDCIDDDTEPSIKPESSDFYDVLNLFNISDIHMIGWGTSNNKSVLSDYIKLLPNGGTFCDLGSYNSGIRQMTGYQNCIDSTAKYIADLIKQSMREDYVIIDNPTSISVNPDSARELSKWSFEHDITKLTDSLPLDNNLGYSDYQGKENVKFSRGFQFDKPGIYYIKYGGQLVKKVTAHRNPTAIINYDGRTQLRESLYTYNFSSASFDIDSNSDLYDLGKGIKKLIWRYRTDGGTWQTIEGKTSVSIEIDTDKNTDIQLTAVDYLGAEVTTTRTINDASRPVAFFAFASNPISLHENIAIIDSSYDTLGREITKREWVIKDGNGKVLWTGTAAPNFTPSSKGWGIGDYTVSLTVTNSKGVKSYTYTAGLTVKKVVANALYQFNWKEASHDNYDNSVQVEYKSKYPNLVSPKKYYTIKYDKNTGTAVGIDSSKAESVFDGWYLDENLVDKIIPNSTIVKGTGNHMIYAKWVDSGHVTLPSAEKIYKVSFDKNDTALDSANLSTTSLTETWDFTGWYDNSDCTKKIGNTGDKLSNINSNQTLYAGWKDVPVSLPSITKQYTATFNTNQGTLCSQVSSDVEFKGWYNSASGGEFKGKAGDKYSVAKNETLYAHWGTASVTLPSTSKDDAQFIGWFDTQQANGKSNGASKAKFIGKAGDTIELTKSITLYAWFNTKPSLTKLDDKDFFEGQRNIGVSDLLSLVVGEDIEDTEGKHKQEVTLDSIKYSNGDRVDVSDDFTLDTSTKHIGAFEATYSITDLGIFIGDKVIESSPVTTVVTFKFNIKHNSAPVIKLSPSIFTYTNDIMLTKDTIKEFLLSHIDIDDEEDSKDNSPFWSKDNTIKALQDNTTILQVKNVVVNPAFAIENKSTANEIKKYNTLGQIYDLKNTNFNAFRAITSYEVVLDTHDQFGKYSSGKITPEAKLFGVSPCEDCNAQSEGDRTILVTQLDGFVQNSTYNHVRDVSMAYLDTVRTKSYWGDPSYGGKFLYSVLAKHGNKAKEPSTAYRGTYTQVNNDSNKIDVTVNDYTEDKTVEDNEDPILTYKVTNNFDDKQTVTLTGKDKISGIGGYYVGTVEPTEENIRNESVVFSFNKFAEIRNEGTWYFAVKDNNDNVAYTSVNFYQVDLDLSNKNIDSGNLSIDINKIIALENSEVELPVVETTGMRADNWLYNSKEIDKLVVTSSCTIVPNWHLCDFTITFNPNEGACDTKSKSVTYLDSVGELPVPEREGYSFIGWYLGLEDDSLRLDENSKYTWGTGITVYAHWKINSYTLTFFLDDEDLKNNRPYEDNIRTLNFNEPYGVLPTTPTRKGYTFLGWFDGDDKVEPETKMKARNVNVVAKWKVNSYTITLNGNKGSGSSDVKLSTSSVTCVFNDYVDLPEPSREGYNFRGWGLSDDWNSDKVASRMCYDFDRDITLYAHWKPKSYTIILDPINGYKDESVSSSGSLTSLGKVGTPTGSVANRQELTVDYDSVVILPDNFIGAESDDGKHYYVKRWSSRKQILGDAKNTYSKLPTEVVDGKELPVLSWGTSRYTGGDFALQNRFVFRYASSENLYLYAHYACEYDTPASFGENTHDNYHHSIVKTHYLNRDKCVGYCEHCGKKIEFEHKHKPGGTLESHDECALCGTIFSSKHDIKLRDRDEVAGVETYACSCGYSYDKYFIAYTKQGYGGTVDNQPHTIRVNVKTMYCTIKYGTSEGKYNLDSPPSYTERGEHKIYFQIEKAGYPTVRDFASVVLKNPNVTAANMVVEKGGRYIFDILGNGSVETTYSNYGYYCNVRVDGADTDISQLYNDSTLSNGIHITRESSTYNEYGRVMTTYTLTNTTSQPHTVDLAVHTDTQVASDDYASTYGTDYGYYTMADGYRFAYYVRNTEGVDNVDSIWVGHYSERTYHLWDYNSFVTSCSGVDSGMAFSWMNRVIKPGESITLTWGMDVL